MSLFVIGNPLLDCIVSTDDEFIRKHGKEPGLASLADDKDRALFDELQKFPKIEYIAGGSGQNTARGVAFMNPDKKGIVHYAGSIGKDKNGRILRAEAEKAGVVPHYYESNIRTGSCAVLVSHTERTLVADLAAANDYQHSHFLSDEVQNVLKNATMVYAASFFLTVSPNTLVEIGKHCAEHNKPLLLNIAAPFLVQFFWDKMAAVLPYVDYVFGNESEGKAITEKLGGDPANLKAGLKLVADFPKVNAKRTRTVVFTKAADPVLILENGVIREVPHEVLPKEKIVDMNGAGDSFCSGFLAGLLRGKDTDKCIAAGHYLAINVIQRSGATFPEKMEFDWDA